jgi:hypothetical protein
MNNILQRITFSKVKNKFLKMRVSQFYGKKYYNFLYISGWHAALINVKHADKKNYFTAIPNRGAGIGHQIANWNAGYWFAKKFNLNFAHIPFSTSKWEDFLGFGNKEVLAADLVNSESYKRVRLPLFDENDLGQCYEIEKIINSYCNKNVLFIAEQDQFYEEQYGVIDDIKHKYYDASVRREDEFIFTKDTFNVALHVRRGDIVIGQKDANENLTMRWQNNDYFVNVLSNVLNNIKTNKPIAVYLFSQGEERDFSEFSKFNNLNFCLTMGAQKSFSHMVSADLLITSKSSFSYKPALLSKGIKVCPKGFWHGYPKNKLWVLADEVGKVNVEKLEAAVENYEDNYNGE